MPEKLIATGCRDLMVNDRNKAVYRRFIREVFNEGGLETLEEVLSPSYICRDAPPGTPPGPEGIKEIVSMFRAGFPDLGITIDEQVAEGDLVCSRATLRGTHPGVLFGIPGTGKAVTMPGLTMVRIIDGRLVESWVKNDVMGLMSQLGAGAPSS
jgi:predicted ester cyclase